MRWYDHLGAFFMAGLAAMLGASLQALGRLVGAFALGGLIARRERGEPFGLFDAGCAIVAVVFLVWVGHRIVRPRVYTVTIARYGTTRVDAPTSSWAHVLFDLCFIAIGLAFVRAEWSAPPRPDGHTLYGIGIGFLGVTVPHLALRLVFWRRRPPADETGLR